MTERLADNIVGFLVFAGGVLVGSVIINHVHWYDYIFLAIGWFTSLAVRQCWHRTRRKGRVCAPKA